MKHCERTHDLFAPENSHWTYQVLKMIELGELDSGANLIIKPNLHSSLASRDATPTFCTWLFSGTTLSWCLLSEALLSLLLLFLSLQGFFISSEEQQVSSDLLESSTYSSRFWKWCCSEGPSLTQRSSSSSVFLEFYGDNSEKINNIFYVQQLL